MKKVLVIDVETVDIRNLDIYEIGYVLLDLEDGTMISKSMLIKEVYESDLYTRAYFYEKNHKRYEEMLEDDDIDISIMSVAEAIDELNRVFKEYRKDIAYISAFNMSFDLRALNFTFNKYLHRENKSQLNYEKFMKAGMLPIDSAVLFALFESKHHCYRCFCEKNGFYTDKGNIKTTAEIVYKYVANDLNFEEDHIGMYDAEVEANIFEYSMMRCLKYPDIVKEAHKATLKGTKPYIIFRNAKP